MHALHCDDLVCGGLALFVESIWFVLSSVWFDVFRWWMWMMTGMSWEQESWSWRRMSWSYVHGNVMLSSGLTCACVAMATIQISSHLKVAVVAKQVKVRLKSSIPYIILKCNYKFIRNAYCETWKYRHFSNLKASQIRSCSPALCTVINIRLLTFEPMLSKGWARERLHVWSGKSGLMCSQHLDSTLQPLAGLANVGFPDK